MLKRTKVEYLGLQEGIGNIPSMILVNIPCNSDHIPDAMSTVVYNPYEHKMSWEDVFKLKVELGFLDV